MKNWGAGSLLSTTTILLIIILAAAGLVGAVLSPDDCSQNVDIANLPFSSSSLSCVVAWADFNFILRYNYNTSMQRLSILLSANTASNWFAMGFSPTGSMVGASAMVGYTSIQGDGVINQYYLAGRTVDQVIPFEGNLTVIPLTTVVITQNQTIYMIFQINISESLAASSKVIYAYALNGQTPNDTGYIEGIHRAAVGMSFDFTTGSASSISNPIETLRKIHGVANIFAWALLAPIGAFIARYLRQRDPSWFFLHVGFQTSSFLLAIIGVALGIKLTQDLPTVDWKYHRILGISVLVLATLQIIALCGRPNKDSKARVVWNWYHFIVGRVVLLLAAVNIIVGLNLAGAGRSWRAGYALILVITLLAFMILESIYWYKWLKRRRESRRPNTAFSSYEMM